MTALTPDCDPDLAGRGRSAGTAPRGGLRSTVLLLVVLLASVLAATAEAERSGAAYLAGGVALFSGLVLARRSLRLARRVPTAVVVSSTGGRSRRAREITPMSSR